MQVCRYYSILLLLLPLSVLSQVLPFQKYTTRNGLIADRITTIHQDNKGFLWLGSYFGICRYDGLKFEKIELPVQQQNKFVAAILPVGDKVYCSFFLKGGLAEIHRGKVTSHFIPGNIGADIVCLYDDGANGLLVATSSNDIYQFHNGSFTLIYDGPPLPSGGRPYGLVRDRQGNIWLGTEGGLTIIPIDAPSKVYHAFPNQFVFCLQKNREGDIWMLLFDGVHGSAGLYTGYQNNAPVKKIMDVSLSFIRPVTFTASNSDELWCYTYNNGLCRIDKNGATTYFQTAVEQNADINHIFRDREQNVWVANDPGIIKITNFSALSYYFKELAPGGGSVLIHGNDRWVNNSKYLYSVTEHGMQKVKDFRERTDAGYLGMMYRDEKANIWISRWDQGFWRTKWNDTVCASKDYFSHINDHPVSAAAFTGDGKGNVWFGGVTGIFRMHNGKLADAYTPENIGNLFVTTLSIDTISHHLWAGENTRGVFKIHYQEHPDGKFTYNIVDHIEQSKGLTDGYVRSILFDSHRNVWVGTRVGGIFLLKENESNGYSVRQFSNTTNVECSRVTSIVEEKGTAVWFATNNGVFRYLMDSEGWEHLSVSDGILSSEVFSIAFDDNRKEIWALTIEGISKINIRQSKIERTPPLVNLTAITVLGKPDTAALYTTTEKKFSSSQNSIGFVFSGASFIDEKKVLYRYQLEGFDKTLSQPVSTNNVNYASLPPGTYTFRVFAANAQGTWSEEPAAFSFRITIPFYKSPWFFIGITTIAAILFYFFRIDRLKQQYKIEKVRLGIARDLHDDIGSALGSINILSKTANRKLEKTLSAEEIAGTFNKIGESAQTTLESMDDIIWTINPEKDKLEDLIVRMREFAIPLLEARDIRFAFELVSADYERVPMNARRNIFLIFKEAIHNIIRHAECTSVTILTGIRNNQFMLQVTDDGKGFEPGLAGNRHGLQNMFHRAASCNGNLSIDSFPGRGTKILFTVKIK